MSKATIPSPSEHEVRLAKQWIENGADAALAQVMAEVRWLRNLLHPTGKKGEAMEQDAEHFLGQMAQDAVTIKEQDALITKQRVELERLRNRLLKRQRQVGEW